MLILTRKLEDQILIGDDVKLTICRIDGNRVRVGIDAPPHVRILRGELQEELAAEASASEAQISDREQAFAHPQPVNRLNKPVSDQNSQAPAEPAKMFTGTVRSDGQNAKVKPAAVVSTKGAPLAGYVNAS